MKYNETLNTLAKCFDEIESLMTIVSERLRGSNIPVKALIVEHWPELINAPLTYKIWNGVKHLETVGETCAIPSTLTVDDIIGIVKRKEILMRKF